MHEANDALAVEFEHDKQKVLFGSSADTYWPIRDPNVQADFLRVRERDGCVQVTVKGKDRGSNLNRMEKEYVTTDSLETVIGVHTAALGKPAGIVAKSYYVYWLNATDTVCCYVLTEPEYDHVIVEVEARSLTALIKLEARVKQAFVNADMVMEAVGWSLFERFIEKQST